MNPDIFDDHGDLDQRLGSYVDGELSAADAAEFASLLTRDRTLARRVATLTQLKAQLRAGVEPAPSIVLPDRFPTGARRYKPMLAAAALLATAMTGLFGWSFLHGDIASSSPASAWDRHDRWVAQSGADGTAEPAAAGDVQPSGASGSFLQTRFPQASHDLYLPDLSAARLMLTHTEFSADADRRAVLHAGYVGSRGCRISLFIYAEPTLDRPAGTDSATPRPISNALRAAGGPAEALAWRNGALHYLVLAHGMDPAHFATVSETVRRLTIEQQPPDAATAIVLAESRARAEPCRA